MTDETDRIHPDEATLIAWLDEPATVGPDVRRHVEACEACADRVAGLRGVLDGLAAEPAMPDRAALAASRERIREALESADAGTGDGIVRSFPAWRPVAWASLLAAAALAALLFWSPGADEPPPAAGDGVPASATIARVDGTPAIDDEAERAAEAVVAAALPETTGEDADEALLDKRAVESLAEIESTTASLVDESAYESTLLADRFASLSEEDQAAILDELSDMTFEL